MLRAETEATQQGRRGGMVMAPRVYLLEKVPMCLPGLQDVSSSLVFTRGGFLRRVWGRPWSRAGG